MSSQTDRNEVTIELKSTNDNIKNDYNDNVEDSSRVPLTSTNIQNMELYDVNKKLTIFQLNLLFNRYLFNQEYHEKPLGKFLNSILNFNSLIPPNKDINDESKNEKSKVFFF